MKYLAIAVLLIAIVVGAIYAIQHPDHPPLADPTRGVDAALMVERATRALHVMIRWPVNIKPAPWDHERTFAK